MSKRKKIWREGRDAASEIIPPKNPYGRLVIAGREIGFFPGDWKRLHWFRGLQAGQHVRAAEFLRAKNHVLKTYDKTFAALAAYDRGEKT